MHDAAERSGAEVLSLLLKVNTHQPTCGSTGSG
jgi:hypothetical protein